VVLSCALAIFVCFVSGSLSSRFAHRNESIQQQFAVLNGAPLLFDGKDHGLREWRGRILFPLTFATISSASNALSVSQWFLLLRTLSAVAAFGAFWFVLRKTVGGDVRLTAAGMFLLAYEVIFTFSEGWENTTDFGDVGFTALFLWAIVTARRWWLAGIVLLATLNRESSVFAGLIWLFVYALGRRFSIRPREVAFGVGLSVVAYAEALLVRTVMPQPTAATAVGGAAGSLATPSDPGYVGQLGHAIGFWNRLAFDVSDFLHHATPTSWPVMWLALLTPAVAWIWLNRSCMRTLHRRLLLAAVCIFPITLMYGTISELREYLTPLVMLAYVAVALEGERTRPARVPVEVGYAPARQAVEA
jgi:hypothetical protein